MGDHKDKWGTVGVSENIMEATWQALADSIEYKLLLERLMAYRDSDPPNSLFLTGLITSRNLSETLTRFIVGALCEYARVCCKCTVGDA